MRVAIAACVAVLAGAPSAFAQPPAPTTEALAGALSPGQAIVVETASGEVWGQVERISGSSIEVRVRMVRPEGGFTTTAKVRVFDFGPVLGVYQSDHRGRRGRLLYPPSWHEVEAMGPGTSVRIVTGDGMARTYRLATATREALELTDESGHPVLVPKTGVRRITKRGDQGTADGVLKGAVVGAGAMWGFVTIAYARCDAGCEAPEYSLMAVGSLLYGAGIGAGAGWLIDRLHVGETLVFPASPPRASRTGGLPRGEGGQAP